MTNKKKILYAEDDDSIRNHSMQLLSLIISEYEIQSFKNGISLDKRLNEDVNGVAAVITDHNMPGFNGGDLIKKYAKQDKFKKIPFFLVYGGEEAIGREALFNGAFTYALKPFRLGSLVSCLKEAIDFL